MGSTFLCYRFEPICKMERKVFMNRKKKTMIVGENDPIYKSIRRLFKISVRRKLRNRQTVKSQKIKTLEREAHLFI